MVKKKTILITAIIVGALIVLGLVISYQTSITGVVVDAETGQPVEGAVVLVEWTKQIGIGDYHTASMRVVETVANGEGKFYVFGTFYPFMGMPDVTIYKKGYVAWNNKYMFPTYVRRLQSATMYSRIHMEHFRKSNSHDKHVDFIRGAINSTIASNKKETMRAAFEWEIELALKERQ